MASLLLTPRVSLFAIFLTFGGGAVTLAVDSATQAEERRQADSHPGEAEQAIGKRAAQIQGDLEQILAEVRLNCLDTMDVAKPNQVIAQLSNLSKTSIPRLIQGLQSSDSESQARPQLLVEACRKQVDLEMQMKETAIELSSRVAQVRIPHHLIGMIVRQSANIRQTSGLPASIDPLNLRVHRFHEVVEIRQALIEAEINLLAKTVIVPKTTAADDEVAHIAARTREAMDEVELKNKARRATEETKSGFIPDAVTRQLAVKENLLTVLHASLSQADRFLQLLEAKAQLDKSVADQRALKTATVSGKVEGNTLAERQGKIHDHAEVSQILLSLLNKPAADQIGLAQEGMGQDTVKLRQGRGPDETGPVQDEISQRLAEAERLLQSQIDAAKAQGGGASGDGEMLGEEDAGEGGGTGTGGSAPGVGSGGTGDQEGDPSGDPLMGSDKPWANPGAVPAGQVIGTLSPKDRDAISRYQDDKTPAEYAPMVRQYQRSLTEPDASP